MANNNFQYSEEFVEENKNTTSIHKLTGVDNSISFLDETRQVKKCNLTMVDFKSGQNILRLKYKCFWCKHFFNSQPIGCPIKYNSKKAVKKYFSKITKEIYTIKESISINKGEQNINDDSIEINPTFYYDSDGIFCSFNCCKSWILDNKHVRLYDHSLMLINKIYNEITENKNEIIIAAPHWRLLTDFGGHLNINDFRKNFNKIEYKLHGISRKNYNFVSVSQVYEENIKF